MLTCILVILAIWFVFIGGLLVVAFYTIIQHNKEKTKLLEQYIKIIDQLDKKLN